MSSEWPSGAFSASAFDALQAGLTVAMIATPRRELKTCGTADKVSDVVTSAKGGKFDYLPVVEGEDAIVGMFHARAYSARTSSEPVVKHMEVLSERHLIGADTSILAFIVEADTRPSRLVVAGGGFAGLVALSDLQKLPVRASLFAAITAFEMTMLAAIRSRFAGTAEWKALLTDGRRRKVQEEIDRSRKADGIVDELLFTQFCDKGTIIARSLDLGRSRRALEDKLDELQDLRDHLAHANDYAATPDEARRVCGLVRDLLELKSEVASA